MTNSDTTLNIPDSRLIQTVASDKLTQDNLWLLEKQHKLIMGLPEEVQVVITGMMKIDLETTFPDAYKGDILEFKVSNQEGEYMLTHRFQLSQDEDKSHYVCFNAQGTVIGILLNVGDIDGALVSPPKRLGIIQ